MTISIGKRPHAFSDSLSLLYRALLGITFAAVSFVVLLVATLIPFAWIVHSRRWPNWLVSLLGVILALGIPFLVWWAVRWLSRRRYRFSLRSAMISTATLAIALAMVGCQLCFKARERQAIGAIGKDGSYAEYFITTGEDPAWFIWLIRQIGRDPFGRINYVVLQTDRAIPVILNCK